MASKQWALANLFGPSNDARFAELIKQLSEVVGECSRHLALRFGFVDFREKCSQRLAFYPANEIVGCLQRRSSI
jgi:hypothetical protein